MLSSNRMLDWAVGGWSLNVVDILQSGFSALPITQPNNNSVISTLPAAECDRRVVVG
jgi:hypothetical protein